MREKLNESAEEHYELVAAGPEKFLKSLGSIHIKIKIQQKMSRLEVNSLVEQVHCKFGKLSAKEIFSVSWCLGKELSAHCSESAGCMMKRSVPVFQSGRRCDYQESLV